MRVIFAGCSGVVVVVVNIRHIQTEWCYYPLSLLGLQRNPLLLDLLLPPLTLVEYGKVVP